MVVNTTSRFKDEGRGLSPFVLPGGRAYDGTIVKNVENFWQYTKCFPQHVKDGEPTPEYFEWARKGWGDTYAHRYPMGKGAIPLFSYWAGHKLGYLDAKEKLYIPLYARAVFYSKAYEWLKTKKLEADTKSVDLILLDFDAYDHRKSGLTWLDVPRHTKKFGHAFVLAFLLEGLLDDQFKWKHSK